LKGIALSLVDGVVVEEGRFVASSPHPWLKLDVDALAIADQWIRMTYASGLLEPLARPVLRCVSADAHYDQVMPAALFGRAFWLGRIPKGSTEIWISPTNRCGAFSFRVEELETVGRVALLWRLFRESPWRAAKCVAARIFGHRELARLHLRRALCATRLNRYDAWRKARLRPFEPATFDRCEGRAIRQPHFRILAQRDREAPEGLNSLLSQLSAQPYPNWTLGVVGAPARGEESAADERLMFVDAHAPLGDAIARLDDDDFVIQLTSGDLLSALALEALAGAIARDGDADAFYGDEDRVDGHGVHCSPRLKPDWSPRLCESTPYLDSAIAVKAKVIKGLGSVGAMSRAGDIANLGAKLDPSASKVRHIRRILLTRRSTRQDQRGPSRFERRTLLDSGRVSSMDRLATIIVPTRDRLDLLEACVESVTTHARAESVEILVVDNGSVEARTKAYLAKLAKERNCRVLPLPGPFNYSQLCNSAATKARTPFLVFLNNDVEIVEASWLERLLVFAGRPDIGAVGAKLLYPNGRIQHAGIVVGIDGLAGHFQRGLAASSSGYFGRLRSPHEVSAVTAACLAIESKKFFAVGGFDERNLPVDLCDVDLCQRLTERGWRTVCEPTVRLVHRESATRGANVRLDDRYKAQHDYFRARWSDAIRDDPYFHPALSLDTLSPALG
jgi:GT2 family glycosyltransferase